MLHQDPHHGEGEAKSEYAFEECCLTFRRGEMIFRFGERVNSFHKRHDPTLEIVMERISQIGEGRNRAIPGYSGYPNAPMGKRWVLTDEQWTVMSWCFAHNGVQSTVV